MSAAPAPAGDPLQDRTLRVETPEHVTIEYPLAGLGSRFAALLADLLVLFTLLVAVPLTLVLIAALFRRSFDFEAAEAIFLPAMVIYTFAVFWGYFFLFEAFRDGQTVGKRWMSIRVVMDGGYPITVEAAAIRNLIRAVDIIGFGLVGGFTMLLSPRTKRLGDLAAATVVVREVAAGFPEAPELPPGAGPPRLPDAAFEAVELYADRRAALEPAARARLSRRLGLRLVALDAPRAGETADAYLVRFHAEERARRLAAHRGERGATAAAVTLLRAKRARWEEFRALAERVRRRGLSRLGEDRVGEFAARYRELTADLARTRTYGGSAATIYALERLVGAGHNLFYRPARRSVRLGLLWLGRGFPALVRKRLAPIALAAALLFGPGLLSYGLLLVRPEFERQLVGVEMIARAEEAAGRRARGEGYIDVPLSHAFLASVIVSNNIQVSFLAFALGVTAGLGTAAVLIVNGLHLGSVLAVFHNRAVLDVIGVFVLPHGVIELTAIAIAGGAGLSMGSGLLLPGRESRRGAFLARAREAVSLIGGVIALLIAAGLIEGFISPARIPDLLKLAVALLAAGALASYLLLAGRGEPRRTAGASPGGA